MTTTLRPPDHAPAPAGPPDPQPLAGPVDGLRSLAGALLAAGTAWIALLAWRPMAQDPGRITRPLVVAALIVALVGWSVRRLTGSAWPAVPAQLLVLLLWLMHSVSGTWLPRPGAVRALVAEIGDGVLAAHRYYSPVSVEHPEFHFMVMAGGVAIVLAVDLLACGGRQPALAGLPLLLVITIAASVLLNPMNLLSFAGTALGWLALLALRESGRLEAWAHPVEPARVVPVAATIGVLTVVVAVVLTGGVSSEGRLLNGGGDSGDGPAAALNLSNPLLDMRRNLRQPQDTPLVQVSVPEGTDPSYLRLTVLDRFTGSAWAPSGRTEKQTEPVRGSLPVPQGVDRAAQGPASRWRIQVLGSFGTTWLPLPFPTTTVSVGSQWRYNPSTLDVLTTGPSAAGLRYTADTFETEIDPAAVRRAPPAPTDLSNAMTSLPDSLPAEFRQTADRVTRGADNDWDRAVALQTWFRSTGGFRYSTEPASGNGLDTLRRFITTDRVGYCEQFSTAMALMARSLGIPARVSVGFLHAEAAVDRPGAGASGRYVFSSQDLHAWPELYFQGVGWTRFEPTPGIRTGTPPSYTEQQRGQDAPSATPTPTATPIPSPVAPTPSAQDGAGGAGALGLGLWSALVLLVLVLAGLALAAPRWWRRTTSRRRWAGARDPRALADAAWADVRETSRDLDLGWSDTASVRVNGAAVRTSVPEPKAQDALAEVVRFVELTRYARADDAVATDTRDRVRDDVTRWRAAAYDAVDPRVARRARWWPRRG